MTKRSKELSSIDKNILRVLQKDGRISYAALSRQVGLSATPCMERVKKLEREGVIQGYSASINP
ncbi:MAG: Lrp/AsnC family transcriptional regulator, partial [Pseudomonadales bacterium]